MVTYIYVLELGGLTPPICVLNWWDVPKATFAPDGECPADFPDFSNHHNFMTENLTKEIYDSLKDKKTSGGCTLAQCIKTGVDNKGSREDAYYAPALLTQTAALFWLHEHCQQR